MKTVCESLLTQKVDAGFLVNETLAIISAALSIKHKTLEKISVALSLSANWEFKSENKQYPLDSIKLEIGYSDSKGTVNFKNSATIISGKNAGFLMPLIWNQSNSAQAFQTDFVKGAADNVIINYKILFKISPALPADFKNEFSGTEVLAVDKNEKDYVIKIFLQ